MKKPMIPYAGRAGCPGPLVSGAQTPFTLGAGSDDVNLPQFATPPPIHSDPITGTGAKTLPPFAASWGAKRARTVSGGRRAAARSSASSCTRDWTDLGDGPAGLIAEFALASGGVADYVRFRSACAAWRRCSLDPRSGSGLDSRFLPREWIMLDKAHAGPRRRRFLNISTGECVRMDLPELDDHRLLALTPEGLLLLLHEDTLAVRLLNPLTRQLTDLPRVTELLQARGYKSARSLEVYGVGLVADTSSVAVCFYSPMVLAVAKPVDKSWTVVYDEYMNSTLPFAGRFYCATRKGVMVLDTTSDQQPPRLLMVADLRKSFPAGHRLHLVDNDGELMLVQNYYQRKCDVYRVDLEAGLLTPVTSFNGRAVFMGMMRTISVPTWVFPHIVADALYLGWDGDWEIVGYNIADGSRIPCQHPISNEWVGPVNIINCLCKCIQGIGRLLA